jgi:hypothetical protein
MTRNRARRIQSVARSTSPLDAIMARLERVADIAEDFAKTSGAQSLSSHDLTDFITRELDDAIRALERVRS